MFPSYPGVSDISSITAVEYDWSTQAARFLVKVVAVVLAVLIPVRLVVHFALSVLTLSLYRFPLSILASLVWIPIFGGLLGTSWAWMKVAPLRVVLLPVGLLLVFLGEVILMLAPPPIPADYQERWEKATLLEEWPLSWLVFDFFRLTDSIYASLHQESDA